MRKSISIATLACVPLALSCGGDSNNKTIHTTDAKVFKDGPPVACTATSTYGAVTLAGSANQDERSFPSKPNGSGTLAPYEEVLGVLNADAMPDLLFLDLYPGYGPFKGSNDLKTGTFMITGDDLSFATCGVCPLLGTDYIMGSGETDDYYAIDGSVTITSFGSDNNGSNGGSGWSGTLAGSVSNMHFTHVMFDSSGNQTPAGDGCTSAIDSMSFSGTLVQETRFQNTGPQYRMNKDEERLKAEVEALISRAGVKRRVW
jgi:hypothetical protein